MIIVENGKTHLLPPQEVSRRKNMSQKEREIRFKIAHEKRHYENYVFIMTHRLELGAIDLEKYLQIIQELKQRRDTRVGIFRKELEKLYKPVVRYNSAGEHYTCANENFRKEYGLAIFGMGNSPKEAYEDWKQEMIDYGYWEDL